jgi:5'-nucleotidase
MREIFTSEAVSFKEQANAPHVKPRPGGDARVQRRCGSRVAPYARMRILVSNDDGIYSPGIAALAEVASEFGTVRVVAPDMERSSAGHAITASRPLSYRLTSIKNLTAYRVNGTPADCVSLGAHHWEKVDLVLSGFNIGLNLGNSIWHSGTLAAAKQATLLGLRGVALSAPAGAEPDFEPRPRDCHS